MSKYLYHLPILLLTLWAVHTPAIAQAKTPTNLPSRPSSLPQQSTGIVKQVDDIAQRITVRIEAKSGNGSGVIIARSGNTYSVITAAHVVKNRSSYFIVTPDRQRIAIDPNRISILNKDLDLALVQFTSTRNYRTAELANYQFTDVDWVFVSGFPGRDPQRRRQLSSGVVWSKDLAEFQLKNRFSFSNGNQLIYTNLSLPGMSGGGILDRQGRLVGINTGAENERIITKDDRQEEINFGYALGIPTTTILGVLTQSQLSIDRLKVTTTPAAKLTDRQSEEIRQHLLSALSPPSQTSTATAWLDYGNLLWRSARNESAVAAFDRAIGMLKQGASADKDRIKLAYFGKGLAFQGIQRELDAQVAFQAAIAVDPEFGQAWRYQGEAHQKLKQLDRALISYQKAIELDPDNFALYVLQGDLFRKLKRYPDALNSYRRSIQLQPNNPLVFYNQGVLYQELEQYAQAAASYSKTIKIDSQNDKAYNNRGISYKESRQYPLAIADFNRSIALKPQDGHAYYNRGNVYLQLKQYPRAIADFNKAIEFAPQVAIVYYGRGSAYHELKQYQLEIADLSRAIALDPQFVTAYNDRGLTYQDLQQYPQAIADFDRAISLSPQLATTYYNRGNVRYALKQYAQAMTDYDRAIKLDPKIVLAYNNRGLVHFQTQQYPQALANFNKALELDPAAAMIYNNRALVYLKLKKYDLVKINLEKAAHLLQQQGDLVSYREIMKNLQELSKLPK